MTEQNIYRINIVFSNHLRNLSTTLIFTAKECNVQVHEPTFISLMEHLPEATFIPETEPCVGFDQVPEPVYESVPVGLLV